MRRIVSVWLIDWPAAVWRRSAMRARRPASPPDPALDPQNPFALILRNSRGAAILHALNPAARAAGLCRGQTQADARAMIPRLICKPADPEGDARALTALAVWAERWSPSVSVDPTGEGLEGLFLDLTGAAHLFGGEAALLSCFSFIPAQWLLRSDTLQAMFQYGWREALAFLVLLLPFAAAMSALLMAIAIRCKSFKEAQTGSTVVLAAVSLLPLVSVFDQRGESPWHLWVPALAQSTLMARVLKGEALSAADLAVPLTVCAGLTVLGLMWVARRLNEAAVR